MLWRRLKKPSRATRNRARFGSYFLWGQTCAKKFQPSCYPWLDPTDWWWKPWKPPADKPPLTENNLFFWAGNIAFYAAKKFRWGNEVDQELRRKLKIAQKAETVPARWQGTSKKYWRCQFWKSSDWARAISGHAELCRSMNCHALRQAQGDFFVVGFLLRLGGLLNQ